MSDLSPKCADAEPNTSRPSNPSNNRYIATGGNPWKAAREVLYQRLLARVQWRNGNAALCKSVMSRFDTDLHLALPA
jgi:hypothetical protein